MTKTFNLFIFLQTNLFNFNKWDLKWKGLKPYIIFNQMKLEKIKKNSAWRNPKPTFYKFKHLLLFYEN